MSGTTHSLIRAAQLEVLRELVPTGLPAERFRVWEGDGYPDFAAWADAGAGPLRAFDIVHAFDLGPEKYLDEATAGELHTEMVLVAYPATRTWEGKLVEDLIDEDVFDISHALGDRGHPDYEGLGHGLHRCALVATRTEERPAARILVMTFELDYDRSMS